MSLQCTYTAEGAVTVTPCTYKLSLAMHYLLVLHQLGATVERSLTRVAGESGSFACTHFFLVPPQGTQVTEGSVTQLTCVLDVVMCCVLVALQGRLGWERLAAYGAVDRRSNVESFMLDLPMSGPEQLSTVQALVWMGPGRMLIAG